MNETQLERLIALFREWVESEIPQNYSGRVLIDMNLLNGCTTKATVTKDVRIK